jgi:hypothetical protein
MGPKEIRYICRIYAVCINPGVCLEAHTGRSNTTIMEERRKCNRGGSAANRLNSGGSTQFNQNCLELYS